MAVDANTVREMAKLAHLDVPEGRMDSLSNEMNAILEHMSAISKWDDEAVPNERPPCIRREDTPKPTTTGLVDASAHVDQASVVVPPIKGAS
mgnify:CR=1 FL=1